MKRLIIIMLIIYIYAEAHTTQREQIIMGTFVSITLKSKQNQNIAHGFKLLKEIEQALSSYNKNALLYQLNDKKSVLANNYLLESIQKSQTYYKKSNGFFNITIGSITKKLYKFGEEETIPDSEALRSANTNIKGIHINQNLITLDENITLDLGGMGKGYGVDKVANYYREQNISYGLIALSGDIQALHPATIYLDSPFNKTPFAKLNTLHPNTSISTSGTYRRYVKSQEHHHLINPKSKKQGRSFLSITLITKQNNALIDAMATAIGVMSKREALNFLVNNPKIAYLLVEYNGNIIYGNFENLVEITWL